MSSRALRVTGIVALSACAFTLQAALSGAEEPVPGEVYGMTTAIDPLVGFDWAPEVDDGEVAALAAAAAGATVSDVPCFFDDRPGVLAPTIFRRPIRTTGHLVVTPSGNATFVCHAAARPANFVQLPTSAIVVDNVPCFLPGNRRTRDTQLVVTPSLHVHLICHVNAAP